MWGQCAHHVTTFPEFRRLIRFQSPKRRNSPTRSRSPLNARKLRKSSCPLKGVASVGRKRLQLADMCLMPRWTFVSTAVWTCRKGTVSLKRQICSTTTLKASRGFQRRSRNNSHSRCAFMSPQQCRAPLNLFLSFRASLVASMIWATRTSNTVSCIGGSLVTGMGRLLATLPVFLVGSATAIGFATVFATLFFYWFGCNLGLCFGSRSANPPKC